MVYSDTRCTRLIRATARQQWKLLALHLGRIGRSLERGRSQKLLEAYDALPSKMSEILSMDAQMKRIGEKYCQSPAALYLGRHFNYPTALEGALKNKEISYMHSDGFPAGEMKHGPIALIDERMPVVTIAPVDDVFEKMIGNMQEVKARGGSVIALTTRGDTKLASFLDPVTDFILAVPRAPALLTPIVMTLPLQLLAYDIAVRRGCDVDQPRNLAKSVTVE